MLFLLPAFTAGKLFLASWIELNNDEAYYWTYTSNLQWNYFDHPPMVALLLKYCTVHPLLQHEFFLRLPFIILGTFNCWLIYRIGRLLRDEFAGLIAACLFLASGYGNLISGFLVLPDAPLVSCWLLSAYSMLVLQKTNSRRKKNLLYLGIGLLIGLAMLSKAQAIFLWPGFLAFLFFNQPARLKNPMLYLAIMVSTLLFLPAIDWMITNQFANFNFHQNRISFVHFKPVGFLREISGEILYQNPIVFYGIIQCLRNQRQDSQRQLLLWLSLPLIATTLLVSFFSDTLPHWTGPAYCTLIPLAAVHLSKISEPGRIPKLAKNALKFLFIALGVLLLCIHYFPGPIRFSKAGKIGQGDASLDQVGWRDFGRKFGEKYAADAEMVLTDYWFPAGQLNFYLPSRFKVSAVGRLQQIHHFAWTNHLDDQLLRGDDALYITPSNYFRPPGENFRKAFRHIQCIDSIPQQRGGQLVRYFYIYRLQDYAGGLPDNGVIP